MNDRDLLGSLRSLTIKRDPLRHRKEEREREERCDAEEEEEIFLAVGAGGQS